MGRHRRFRPSGCDGRYSADEESGPAPGHDDLGQGNRAGEGSHGAQGSPGLAPDAGGERLGDSSRDRQAVPSGGGGAVGGSHCRPLRPRARPGGLHRGRGLVYITTKDNAGEITRKAQERDAATLDFIGNLAKPVRGSGPVLVSDFLDSIMQGLTVLPTEEVWNSSATVNVTPGLRIREALDQLKPQGIRWAARDGKVYVLK